MELTAATVLVAFAGVFLICAGVGVAVTGALVALIAIGWTVFGITVSDTAHGPMLVTAGAVIIGGLVAVVVGLGKAAAGWILVKPDAKL